MYQIILNDNLNMVYEDVDINEIEYKFHRGCGIFYVIDKEDKYIGCMTRKEITESIKTEALFVNCDSYKVVHGKEEQKQVEDIFREHDRIFNIPVIDENGRLLYEYVREFRNENFDSVQYWENRYKNGGNSGNGSYGDLAEFKAKVLNDFICNNHIDRVIEWGFGDGNQLGLLKIPSYTGYDVSQTACDMCQKLYSQDKNKEFRYYDGSKMSDFGEKYDMAISLDVLYHLTEDDKFDNYLYNLFCSSEKYVCIYSSDYREWQEVEHVKRRQFTEYVKERYPQWKMIRYVENPYLYYKSNSNFYFYEKQH